MDGRYEQEEHTTIHCVVFSSEFRLTLVTLSHSRCFCFFLFFLSLYRNWEVITPANPSHTFPERLNIKYCSYEKAFENTNMLIGQTGMHSNAEHNAVSECPCPLHGQSTHCYSHPCRLILQIFTKWFKTDQQWKKKKYCIKPSKFSLTASFPQFEEKVRGDNHLKDVSIA